MAEKLKILIVEDDEDMRRGLSMLLRMEGYDVVIAQDGIAAVSVARIERPDLILLDLGLPAGDGLVVLERYSNLPALCSIPVIVLSGRDPQHAEQAVRKFHVAAFLSKPAEAEDIAKAIERALRGESIAPLSTSLNNRPSLWT